jgi:hypothetical protein
MGAAKKFGYILAFEPFYLSSYVYFLLSFNFYFLPKIPGGGADA